MINRYSSIAAIVIVPFLWVGGTTPVVSQIESLPLSSAHLKALDFSISSSPIVGENTREALDWEVQTRQKGDYYQYYLNRVIYPENDRTVWQVDLPVRMTKQSIGLSFQHPIEIQHRYGFPFLTGTLIAPNLVWIADGTGILAIDKQTGEIVADRASETAPEPFYVDRGTATIAAPDLHCEVPVALGRFLAECGLYVVFFNRGNLEIWNREGPFLELQSYRPTTDNLESPVRLEQRIRISSEILTVEIHGWVYR